MDRLKSSSFIYTHIYTHTHVKYCLMKKAVIWQQRSQKKKITKIWIKLTKFSHFFLSPSYAYDASSIVMFYIINIRSRALCFFKCWGKSMHQLQFMTLFFFIFKNGFLFILLLWECQRELQTPPNSFVVVLTQEIVFN